MTSGKHIHKAFDPEENTLLGYSCGGDVADEILRGTIVKSIKNVFALLSPNNLLTTKFENGKS